MIDNINEYRVSDFIASFENDDIELLSDLKKYAKENDVPIIRDETREFLSLLLNLKKPQKILEIGTAIAYSTIFIATLCKNAHIVTIEDYEPRIKLARENIEKYYETIDFEHKVDIDLHYEDATEYLSKTDSNADFDFIFLDAAKAQYINWLPDIKRLLKKDGILLSDNVFKEGDILESRFLVRKRDRTIHKRMRDFLYEIKHDDELITYIYNIADGISVSIKT